MLMCKECTNNYGTVYKLIIPILQKKKHTRIQSSKNQFLLRFSEYVFIQYHYTIQLSGIQQATIDKQKFKKKY